MTLLLVATAGGHLAQLFELKDRIPGGGQRAWVTFDTPQSRSLLAGERVHFIPFIGERDVAGVLRGLAHARRLFARERISLVVSTGSAIALAYLPYAALRGIEAHYIESSARVGAPSLTGRILQRCRRVWLYRQYPQAANARWQFAGSVFDGFEAKPVAQRPLRRVVVTLGSVEQSFPRLLERLRAVLPSGLEVFWQTGHTPTEGLDIPARPFVPAAELQGAMLAADVVIAHGGCGSALDALRAGRLPILVPRDPARGELVDSHQPQITAWLASRGLALDRTPEGLALADLNEAASHEVTRATSPPPIRLVSP